MDPVSVSEAVKGCDYIVHTASPVPIGTPKDPNSVIKPIVEGVMSVLQAAHQFKVKRVVLTSSMATIIYNENGHFNKDYIFSEKDWSDLKECTPYGKGKVLAE